MAQSDDRERAGRAVPASVQRSFRLSPRTLELLGERAAETSESRTLLPSAFSTKAYESTATR
jgi:hypothetical protein